MGEGKDKIMELKEKEKRDERIEESEKGMEKND